MELFPIMKNLINNFLLYTLRIGLRGFWLTNKLIIRELDIFNKEILYVK